MTSLLSLTGPQPNLLSTPIKNLIPKSLNSQLSFFSTANLELYHMKVDYVCSCSGEVSHNKRLYFNQLIHIHLGITLLIIQKLSSITGLRNHSGGSIFITGLSTNCVPGRMRKFGKAHRANFSVVTSLSYFKAYIKVLVII